MEAKNKWRVVKSDKKYKIIYVTPSLSSFTKNDLSVLLKKHRVITNIYNWRKKQFAPLFLLHQIFFILWHIFSTRRIFISFGGYWSFVPALIGKLAGVPVFIILHGTDCASIPTIKYGSLRKFILKEFCRQSYKLATILLPVSSSLIFTKNTYYSDDKFSFQGYKHFFPRNKTKYEVIANGIDGNFWKPLNPIDKEQQSFIAVFSEDQFLLKGGDLIVKLSDKLPECRFYLAGLDKPGHLTRVPENVFFLGNLSPEKLREYYNKCRFHFQISIFEGFGISLCEAMLCECIPIGSSVNIIPELIGETGFILDKRNIVQLELLTCKALASENKNEMGKNARVRILSNYSIGEREKRLVFLIGN